MSCLEMKSEGGGYVAVVDEEDSAGVLCWSTTDAQLTPATLPSYPGSTTIGEDSYRASAAILSRRSSRSTPVSTPKTDCFYERWANCFRQWYLKLVIFFFILIPIGVFLVLALGCQDVCSPENDGCQSIFFPLHRCLLTASIKTQTNHHSLNPATTDDDAEEYYSQTISNEFNVINQKNEIDRLQTKLKGAHQVKLYEITRHLKQSNTIDLNCLLAERFEQLADFIGLTTFQLTKLVNESDSAMYKISEEFDKSQDMIYLIYVRKWTEEMKKQNITIAEEMRRIIKEEIEKGILNVNQQLESINTNLIKMRKSNYESSKNLIGSEIYRLNQIQIRQNNNKQQEEEKRRNFKGFGLSDFFKSLSKNSRRVKMDLDLLSEAFENHKACWRILEDLKTEILHYHIDLKLLKDRGIIKEEIRGEEQEEEEKEEQMMRIKYQIKTFEEIVNRYRFKQLFLLV